MLFKEYAILDKISKKMFKAQKLWCCITFILTFLFPIAIIMKSDRGMNNDKRWNFEIKIIECNPSDQLLKSFVTFGLEIKKRWSYPNRQYNRRQSGTERLCPKAQRKRFRTFGSRKACGWLFNQALWALRFQTVNPDKPVMKGVLGMWFLHWNYRINMV